MLTLRKLADCRTNADKWHYYAEVYAWRIVRGYGKPEDRTCPVDPHGEWFNQTLVDEAVSRFRRILAAERHAHEEAQSRDEDVQRQNEKYARGLAYRQGRLDEYDAIHHPDKLAERQKAQAETPAPKPHNAEVISNALDDLGVTSQAAE